MKIQQRLAAAFAAILMMSNAFPLCAKSADVPPDTPMFSYNHTLPSGGASPKAWDTVTSGDPLPAPDEAPMFTARIEYFYGQGYMARGTFTEFLPETSLVRPLYSLDGEEWQASERTWNLQWLGGETPEKLNKLQNQHCLYATDEPLAGYLAGQLDRFYLKLQITLNNGIIYETQAAVIDRGDPRPIPEYLTPNADFTPALRVRQWRPFKSQGQYQITVSADATPEDISALLPDTLPICVQLYSGIDFVADTVIDCPVTWKPLSLSRLTPDESVAIENAAERILVPAGTLLNTPTGTFLLDEPLGFDHDEVKLILNVVDNNAAPTGTLRSFHKGLELSFDLKPTGASGIRAYTLSEGEPGWVEIPEPLLPERINAPSSTPGSLFTFVLTNAQEPYHSWLAAWNAGEEPTPFLIGLKIEGGVYDGRQLILAFPDTYEPPLQPPALNGSGGNEDNAGSDNKNDSTPEGQRPNLPQTPEGGQNTVPIPPRDTEDGPDLLPIPPKDTEDGPDSLPIPPKDTEDGPDSLPMPPRDTEDGPDSLPIPPRDTEDGPDSQITETPRNPKDRQPQPYPDEDKTPASPPMVNAGIGSFAWGKAGHGTAHKFLLPTAAAAAVGICIACAAGKITAGSISGKILRKTLHALHSLFHPK